MNLFLTLLISITGVTLAHTAANAELAEECYMIDSSGKAINLTDLCRGTSKKASTNPKSFQAKILRRMGGIPVIDVTFNGKQKFEMLLDTGASQTTITPEMADAIGMVPVGTQKATVASGEAVEFPEGRVASIGVGGAVVKDAMVSVAPVPLLGQNFFGSYTVIIKKDIVEFQAH